MTSSLAVPSDYLANLGVLVLAATAYGVFVLQLPTADLMGLFGAGALIDNAICAAILLGHRMGDAIRLDASKNLVVSALM